MPEDKVDKAEKACFVIAPIGEADSETRKRSDQVLKHIIRPAVQLCGYEAVRADEIDKPGIITSQVIQRVVNDPMVVADLTERNPNVFYELAIRHALRKPLVQLIKKGERIPFDVVGTRTIQVDHRDLDSVEGAKNEIIEQIRSLERDAADIETPISVSLDLQLLRQSENPEERSLADLVAAVADLRSGLAKVESRIGTKDEDGILDEIQSSLKSLPRRLDEYFEMGGPMRRKRRFHPLMIREMMHMGPEVESRGVAILVAASFFRDAMPWVYEVGLEAYRQFRSGDFVSGRETLEQFRRLAEMSIHGPWGREFGRSKDMYMMVEELGPLLDDLTKHYDFKRAPRARKAKRAKPSSNDPEDDA